MMERAGLYGQNRNCQWSGLKGSRPRGAEGNSDVNGAGMFLKINEMRKCHPHQGFWRRGEVGDFASRDAGKANPRGLTHAVAIRYKDSGPSEPKAVIFRGIYRLQLESARFSEDLNAESSVLSRIRSLESFAMLPPIPRLHRLDEKSLGPKVRSSGWGRVRLLKLCDSCD